MVSYKKTRMLVTATLISFAAAKTPDSQNQPSSGALGNSQKVIGVDKSEPTIFTSNPSEGAGHLFWQNQPGYGCRVDDWQPWQDLYGDVPKNVTWVEIEAAERVLKYFRVNPCECFGYKEPCCPEVFAICPATTMFRYPCVDCGGRLNHTRNCCPIT